MRTNVDLDDELVLRCMRITGLRTKKAVVDEAMRTLLRLYGQREVRDLRGRLRWVGPGEPAAGEAGARTGGDAAPGGSPSAAGAAAAAGTAPAAGGGGNADPR